MSSTHNIVVYHKKKEIFNRARQSSAFAVFLVGEA